MSTYLPAARGSTKIDGLSSSLFQCFVMSAVSGGKQVIAFVNLPINLPNAVFELDCRSFGQTRLQINKNMA